MCRPYLITWKTDVLIMVHMTALDDTTSDDLPSVGKWCNKWSVGEEPRGALEECVQTLGLPNMAKIFLEPQNRVTMARVSWNDMVAKASNAKLQL